MKQYNGFIPPCGVFCGGCPRYLSEKNPCLGAGEHCKQRRCKGIFICCTEKKGYRYCYECKSFPCSRFKKFRESWLKLGQDLTLNQHQLEELGDQGWLDKWNGS